MYAIIILFAGVAIIGVTMVWNLFRGRRPPRISIIIHGVLAIVATILLVLEYIDGGTKLSTSLIAFIISALGGVYLLYRDIRSERMPKNIVVIHAFAAIVGLALLINAVF